MKTLASIQPTAKTTSVPTDLLICTPIRLQGVRLIRKQGGRLGDRCLMNKQARWEIEMVPSVIVEITWHAPGGRYHSPSIITADRRWGYAHQRRNQRRPRKWPMDILLRCSAGVSTRRERPPLLSDVYRPTDLPGRVPPGGHRTDLRCLEERRHSERQQVSHRRRERVLHASARHAVLQ